MTINITIVIQIFHFIIAYFIITKILLKPAILIIQQEKKDERNLLNIIKTKQLEIDKKESLKKALWFNSLEKFQQNKPDFKKLELEFISKTPKKQEIDKNRIERLRKSIFDTLVSKVKYVKQ